LLGRAKPNKVPSYRRDWALTRAPEKEGENQDINLETTFTPSLAGHIDMFFFRFFVCNLWVLLIVRVNVVSCRVTL